MSEGTIGREKRFCYSSDILVILRKKEVLVNARHGVRRYGLEEAAEVLATAVAHLFLCQGLEQHDPESGQEEEGRAGGHTPKLRHLLAVCLARRHHGATHLQFCRQ